MKYLQRQILQVKKENHFEFWKIHFFNSSVYKSEKLFIRLIELKGLYSMWNEKYPQVNTISGLLNSKVSNLES